MSQSILQTCPKRRGTTHAETLHDEVCIYEWTTKTVHALNATAARVWDLCDGRTPIAQMAAVLRREGHDTDAELLVRQALDALRGAGLLEEDEGAPPGLHEMSARALVPTLGMTAAIPLVTSIVAPTPLAAQSLGGSQTFNWTGGAQSFVVPAAVTSIQVDVIGASGAGLFPTNPPGFN